MWCRDWCGTLRKNENEPNKIDDDKHILWKMTNKKETGVEHTSVSRSHCKILIEDILNTVILEIRDLKSTNGTLT